MPLLDQYVYSLSSGCTLLRGSYILCSAGLQYAGLEFPFKKGIFQEIVGFDVSYSSSCMWFTMLVLKRKSRCISHALKSQTNRHGELCFQSLYLNSKNVSGMIKKNKTLINELKKATCPAMNFFNHFNTWCFFSSSFSSFLPLIYAFCTN